jgi:phenylacetate-coenzyme A ligase PaaK-like adenylate-forming protein
MSYATDRKLENVYALKDLSTLYNKPIRAKDYTRLVETQNRNIQALMQRAWEVPFYRARFEASGTVPADYKTAEDLYKFPVLTKAELREWMDDEAAKNPEKYASWHVSPTSGSSGAPLRTLVSPKENAWMTANWLRVLSMPGYNPFTGKTMCRPNSLHGAVKERDSIVQRFGILRRKQMSDALKNRLTSEQLLQEINDYKPDYLYNHKNVLVRVAAYVKKTGAYIHKPKFYTPFGEMMDDASRALLTEVYGPGLVDAYGMSEVGSCVIRLPGRDEYQINSDTHVVNIYDAELKNPANDGPAVITPLFKTDLPIINYVSGDSMETYTKAGLRFVKRIKGRMNDVIHHRDGGVTEWGNVAVIMNYIKEVIQYRVVQEDYDNLTIMMVRDPAVPVENQPAIEQTITEKLNTIWTDFSYHYQWLDEIPSDPNGKLRILVSKLQ